MVYLVVLVNVSCVLFQGHWIDFSFCLAGRDGIKGGRGDNGRPGNENQRQSYDEV